MQPFPPNAMALDLPERLIGNGRATRVGPVTGLAPLEPLDALHRRHLREANQADLPRPGTACRCLVAGVDRHPRDRQPRAAGMRPSSAEQCRQRVPARLVLGAAVDDDMVDEPALQPAAPGPDVDLDPVLLHVAASRQDQPASGHGARLPSPPPVRQSPPVRRLAGLHPGLAERGVDEGLHFLVAGGPRRQEGAHHRLEPHPGRVDLAEVEARDAAERRPRPPLAPADRGQSAARPTRRHRSRRSGSAPSPADARRRRSPSGPGPSPAPGGCRSTGTAPSTVAGRSRHRRSRSGWRRGSSASTPARSSGSRR
jgi:hypothetical protein